MENKKAEMLNPGFDLKILKFGVLIDVEGL